MDQSSINIEILADDVNHIDALTSQKKTYQCHILDNIGPWIQFSSYESIGLFRMSTNYAALKKIQQFTDIINNQILTCLSASADPGSWLLLK